MTERIFFYRVGDAHGGFSNFAPAPIEIDGVVWPTSEHFFQAQKFFSPDDREAIRREPSPMRAARMGRDRKRPLRPDWETVKDSVMLTALRAKFHQHPALHELLLATGDAELIEHTAKDRYWADGGDGSGRNMLGELLMRVRSELRQAGEAVVTSRQDSVCEHLRPLELALIGAGFEETSRGQAWSKRCRVWVYFNCHLELPSLRARFHLAECLKDHFHLDSHTGDEAGFFCEEHLDGIMGHHPAEPSAGGVFR